MANPDDAARLPTAPFRDSPRGGCALVIIDLITTMEFGGAGTMLERVESVVAAVLRLRDAADAAAVPVIYVNDNFGEWHSERSRLVQRALAAEGPAADLVERIKPRESDYFIIKPQFSGFYATNLPVLLPKLGVDHLILTGIAADICVLFTAGDAHMRDYRMWVPEDAVAAQTPERGHWALEIMKKAMRAEIRSTRELPFKDWMERIAVGAQDCEPPREV